MGGFDWSGALSEDWGGGTGNTTQGAGGGGDGTGAEASFYAPQMAANPDAFYSGAGPADVGGWGSNFYGDMSRGFGKAYDAVHGGGVGGWLGRQAMGLLGLERGLQTLPDGRMGYKTMGNPGAWAGMASPIPLTSKLTGAAYSAMGGPKVNMGVTDPLAPQEPTIPTMMAEGEGVRPLNPAVSHQAQPTQMAAQIPDEMKPWGALEWHPDQMQWLYSGRT